MRSVFVDFEMQPVSSFYRRSHPSLYPTEIIEIGAVALNENRENADSFRCYVRPSYGELRPEIAHLTGISAAALRRAPSTEEAMRSFFDWLGADACVFAWSESDLKQLMGELEGKGLLQLLPAGLAERWIDFQAEFLTLTGQKRAVSLDKALTSVGEYVLGRAHDALTDAESTATLYRISRDPDRLRDAMERAAHPEAPKTTGYTLAERFGAALSGLQFDGDKKEP